MTEDNISWSISMKVWGQEGIAVFKIFIWGGLLSDIVRNIAELSGVSVATQRDFRPYTQQYTTPS